MRSFSHWDVSPTSNLQLMNKQKLTSYNKRGNESNLLQRYERTLIISIYQSLTKCKAFLVERVV